MAIAPVRKVLIATHKSEEKEFLNRLQELGILHIVQESKTQEIISKTTIKNTLDDISSSIGYLESYTEKQGFLSGFTASKTSIDRNIFLSLAKEYNLDNTINKLKELRQKLSTLSNQKKSIESDINTIKPWEKIKHDLSEVYNLPHVEISFGLFPSSEALKQTQEDIKNYPVQITILNQLGETYYCIVAYPKENKETIRQILRKFEIMDLSKFKGIPQDILHNLLQRQREFEKEITTIINTSSTLVSELPKLKALYDYYHNLEFQDEMKSKLLQSKEVVFIEGWVKQKDLKKLAQVIETFKTVIITPLTKQENEEPPVALENRSIFKPFEIILELYTMPNPVEIDPTPLLAPFFAIFFALCLTDAGYGIILLALSLFLLKKMRATSNFLKLLAICGGFTILAGAITGGWFGDIVDKLGLQFLVRLRNQLLLFDPIKDPMPFFILSVALGYLHLNYGIIIEIYDSFRQKNWQGAVFDQLPWFFFLNGLILYVFTGKYLPVSLQPYLIFIILLAISIIIAFTRRNQRLMFNQSQFGFVFLGGLIYLTSKINLSILPNPYHSLLIGKYLVIFGLIELSAISLINQIKLKKFNLLFIITLIAVIATLTGYFVYHISVIPFLVISLFFIMLSPDNHKLIKNIIWGVYNLYGATSFIGVVLSYIRLMALGMVTAGIAMAINTIAWMVIKIPIIGIVIAIIFLIFGHAYNLAINILGAFVHSLRLNYVEFFPRFFTGGGEKFTPFQEQTKYITIK